jgi:hypothetical protein
VSEGRIKIYCDRRSYASMPILLEYLRNEFELEFGRRKILDAKANHIITVSGTVVTLLFAFIAFLIGNSKNDSISPLISIILLFVMPSILSSIGSMLFAILSSRLRTFPGDFKNKSF